MFIKVSLSVTLFIRCDKKDILARKEYIYSGRDCIFFVVCDKYTLFMQKRRDYTVVLFGKMSGVSKKTP